MKKLLHLLTFPCLLAAVLTLWLRWHPLGSPDSGFVLEMHLASSVTGEEWLWLQTNSGWNKRNTRTFSVVASEDPKTYRISLPRGIVNAFRLVSPDSAAQQLQGARIVDDEGAVVAEFPGGKFDPTLPGIPMVLDRPIRLTAAWERTVPESLLEFAILALTFVFAGRLLGPRAAPWLARAESVGRTLGSWIGTHPRTALAAVAAVAVAASCFPVVFCGKSFVSPNNGALCLYDEYPTLPGAPVGPVERWNNSDVNATPWAHLPYSMVTRDAVLRDHELPLWNRYVMNGLTLLGQGQSMPGDPLFWIGVCADGAAWAWDLRYLVSKWLFAFGIGLLVWKTTQRLPAALLLAASSAFLGFFSYRFNHPAFFSICYSPWILLCWLKAAWAPDLRTAGRAALLLIGANWLELNSGTGKEAAMLTLTMNAAGGLMVLFSEGAWSLKWKTLSCMAAGCAAFVMLSAPLLAVFLDALRRGFTIYDMPEVHQLPAGLLIGLFDELFSRELMADEFHVLPALNFLVFAGLLWALADYRRTLRDRAARSLAVAVMLPLALVLGIIPPGWIQRLPFFRNIIHVDNTFICTLIVPLIVLAGFGLRNFEERLRSDRAWRGVWLRTLAWLALFAALYFGTVQAVTRLEFALHMPKPVQFSAFFLGYAGALLATVALLPWCVRRLALRKGSAWALGLGALLCLTTIHFRHGMWLQTRFDDYVMNPQVRANLQASSPAVEFVRARQSDPARTMGFGEILRPGFNIVTRLEGPAGVDAVTCKALAEWYEASGVPWMSMWWPTVTKETARETRAFYDSMNVRYYLGAATGTRNLAPGLTRIASKDLEVFESETAWPRAFFTDRLQSYRDVREMAGWIRGGDGRPFAAVLENEQGVPALSSGQADRTISPARDYRFTSNTTAFTIDASGPGLVVLNETFVADSFRARVNGKPAPILRVNHIFKGVALPAAGTFRVEFEYWPRVLTPALYVALCGFLATLGTAACLLRRPALKAQVYAGTIPAKPEVRASLTTNP